MFARNRQEVTVKPQRPPRHADGIPLTKTERKALAQVSYDNLQQWINKSFIRAVRLKANEIHYERGKDGLTVQFRYRTDVLKAMGPYQRYQDKAIPRLQKMGEQGLRRRYKGETGRFFTVVDDRELNTPIFYTRTRSGERVVVRFTGSKPYKAR
jgi:type II secretory ATPase GspE/PulE/Tfp pilus assembly ATPase PilB-like protein